MQNQELASCLPWHSRKVSFPAAGLGRELAGNSRGDITGQHRCVPRAREAKRDQDKRLKFLNSWIGKRVKTGAKAARQRCFGISGAPRRTRPTYQFLIRSLQESSSSNTPLDPSERKNAASSKALRRMLPENDELSGHPRQAAGE